MSWAVGSFEGRDIGYGVPATCDHPGCGASIHRGLAYVCGYEQVCGGEEGCGLFFCYAHGAGSLCERCSNPAADGQVTPFDPTPDVPEWIQHKETDPSWAKWRAERDAAKAGGGA